MVSFDSYYDPPDDPPEVVDFPRREVKKTRVPWACSYCGTRHAAGGKKTVLAAIVDGDFDVVSICPAGSCKWNDPDELPPY